MKRLLSLVVLIVTLINTSTYGEQSFNVTHIPIKMLNLDFGCSLLDAKTYLDDEHDLDMGIWSDSEYMTIAPPKSIICDEGTSYDYENHKKIGAVLSDYAPEMDVAGYPLHSIVLYFLYPCDENYKMEHDDDAARMFAAVYTFKSESPHEMFDDIARKLKSVYGEDSGLTSNQIYSHFSDDTVWYSSREGKTEYMLWESDANMSWLVLKSTDTGGDMIYPNIVEIMYISRYGDSWISKNVEARKREKLAAESALYGNNDTSGL